MMRMTHELAPFHRTSAPHQREAVWFSTFDLVGNRPTYKIGKKLSSIQRIFLLYITGSYRTTPTAALQTITGVMPLHLKSQPEAIFINVTCLRKKIEFEGLSYQPRDYEEKIKSLTIHPSLFNIINQISTTEPYKEENSLMFFTDVSKTEMGTWCTYCAFENGSKVLEWKGKLEKFYTVFQTELMGLKEAIIRASQGNLITKIWTDSLSSVMAVLDPHTPRQLVRDIQSLLTLFWLDESKPMLANK
ncbi:hypothetical protein AVEN_62633-1 [Araneus ventricosus]|uniref:RNase H type-1 domain-containing protein n=1 Tax=Araneus ventricosus TaxID=182803 RepID=A0A4Y2H8M6_ARAVE|nr:hypothetical protein AVEN_62633-1 [Araneus ventricosus]